MTVIRFWAFPTIAALSACGVPSFDKVPLVDATAPQVPEIVKHVTCELQKASIDKANQKLLDYQFVASVTLTLQVTDQEQLNPSVNLITPFNGSGNGRTGSIGGAFDLQQDRSFQTSYSIDLKTLAAADSPLKRLGREIAGLPGDPPCDTGSGGISGDLGLNEIIQTGLSSLEQTQDYNVYGASGAQAPAAADVEIWGELDQPAPGTSTKKVHFVGAFLPSPPLSTALAPASTQLSGRLSTDDEKWSEIVSLTGTITLAGTTANPGRQQLGLSGSGTASDGKNYAMTLFGDLNATSNDLNDREFRPSLTGLLTPPADGTAKGPKPLTLTLDRDRPPPGTPAPALKSRVPLIVQSNQFQAYAQASKTPSGGATSATSAGSSGTTSFGSTVDFILTAGLNGGLNLATVHFKGPSAGGSTPLVNLQRATTDTLSITFVATCTTETVTPGKEPNTYWHSLPSCSDVPATRFAGQQGAALGYQQNSLMFLNNILRGSGAVP